MLDRATPQLLAAATPDQHSLAVLGLALSQLFDQKLAALDQSLRQVIFQNVSAPLSLPASGGTVNNIALSQRIDSLSGTTIENPTITGGSITASSITGTISNAIDAALAAIDNLTATDLVAVNATTTNLTIYNPPVAPAYTATSTATSTFVGGIATARIDASGTSTLAGVHLANTDCSSYGNGGKLTTDGFGNVVCGTDSGGAGSTVAGANTQVQFNDAGAFGASASFTFEKNTNKLAVSNASTTNVTATYASSSRAFFGVLTLPSLSSGALAVDANGTVYAGATSTLSTISGTLALNQIANIGANTILGNATGASGNVTAIATSTLFGTGSASQVLAWNNGAPAWVATTTFTAGSNITLTQNGNNWTIAASGGGGGGIADPFTHTSYAGQTTSATSSTLWLTGSTISLAASSSVLTYASSTMTSTALASSTNLYISSIASGALLKATTGGQVTAALSSTDYAPATAGTSILLGNGSGGFSSYAGTSCTNQFIRSTNGAGVATCASVNLASDVTGDLPFSNLAQVSANSILGNPTGSTADAQPVATSTLFGTGSASQVLAWNNGAPQWVATTTFTAGSNITLTQNGNNWTIAASGGGGGGIADPFAHETWWGQANTSATSTALHFTGSPISLFASSTAVFETASSSAASSTRLTVGTQWFTNLTNGGLGVDASGQVYKAATTTFSTGLTYLDGAVTCNTANGSTFGCLSAADWTTFNGKQAAGNYITALTGDVTASGPGSVGATIASNAVTYAKFQQVAANKLLGNPTGSTANVSEIATSTLFGQGQNGYVLAWSGGVPAWVASTTFSAGSGITLAQNGNGWTITNSGASFGFPWTPTTNFGTAANATSTPIWFTNGLFASSTSRMAGLALDGSGYLNFGATTGSSGYGFRDNGGTLEFKNSGGVWNSVNTATSGPSFSVYRATNQTAGINIKVQHDTEVFDTNNNFDTGNNRFTPSVAGKYLFRSQVSCLASVGQALIYKNGSTAGYGQTASAGDRSDATVLLDMNGITDYVEAYGYCASGAGDSFSGGSLNTNFTGALIAPINGNNVANWQYDGTQTTLLDSTKSVGIGTTTPWGKLAISTPSQQSGSIPLFNIASTTGASIFTVLGSGNVGIGTTTPNNKLSLYSATKSALEFSGAAAGSWTMGYDVSNGRFSIASSTALGTTDRLVIDTNGNVGIGTTNPNGKLQVETATDRTALQLRQTNATAGHYWNLGPDGANSFVLQNQGGTGVFIGDGDSSWSSLSDQRLKTNIAALPDFAIDQVLALNPVTFNWKSATAATSTQLGFIAQEVQQVFPDLVSSLPSQDIINADGSTTTVTNVLGINYTGLIVPLVKAVQELAAKLADLASTVAGFADSITTRDLTFTRAEGDFMKLRELCLGSTCITEAQLAALLSQSAAAAFANPTPAPTDGTSTGPTATEPPTIEIQGNNPAHLNIGDSYNDLGATITGPPADLNLGIKTFLNGALVSNIVLDTTAPATDTIDYVAENAAGTSTSTRTVIIEAPQDQTPPPPAPEPQTTPAPATPPDPSTTTTTSTPAQ